MSEVKNGGDAFPTLYRDFDHGYGEHIYKQTDGISTRDYFAAKAMASYLMPAGEGQTWAQRSDFDYIAETAYLAADAMLRARGE